MVVEESRCSMHRTLSSVLLMMALGSAGGCIGVPLHHHSYAPCLAISTYVMPRQLTKVVLPLYTIEPPDILVIEAIHIVPRSPYLLRTSDVIGINVLGTLPDAPVAGAYPIQPGGIVNL